MEQKKTSPFGGRQSEVLKLLLELRLKYFSYAKYNEFVALLNMVAELFALTIFCR